MGNSWFFRSNFIYMRYTAILILIVFMCACSVQKRHYRQGFYVNSTRTEKSRPAEQNNLNAFASKQKLRQQIKALPPDSCDQVDFTDGTSVKVYVVSLDNRQLRYRFCEDEQNRVRAANRAAVLRIKYHNGSVQDMRDNTISPPQIIKIEEPVKTEPEKKPDSTVVNGSSAVVSGKKDTTLKAATVGACDRIMFTDGSEKQAKILEVGPDEIRYKICDRPEGPVYVTSKSQVFMVVYENGSKEVFEDQQTPVFKIGDNEEMPPMQKPVKKRKSLAVWALIASLATFSPLYVAAPFVGGIIMGTLYLQRSKQYPEEYPSTGLAKTAIWIGAIIAFLFITFLLLTFI
jgi:hypothetical protein